MHNLYRVAVDLHGVLTVGLVGLAAVTAFHEARVHVLRYFVSDVVYDCFQIVRDRRIRKPTIMSGLHV